MWTELLLLWWRWKTPSTSRIDEHKWCGCTKFKVADHTSPRRWLPHNDTGPATGQRWNSKMLRLAQNTNGLFSGFRFFFFPPSPHILYQLQPDWAFEIKWSSENQYDVIEQKQLRKIRNKKNLTGTQIELTLVRMSQEHTNIWRRLCDRECVGSGVTGEAKRIEQVATMF